MSQIDFKKKNKTHRHEIDASNYRLTNTITKMKKKKKIQTNFVITDLQWNEIQAQRDQTISMNFDGKLVLNERHYLDLLKISVARI